MIVPCTYQVSCVSVAVELRVNILVDIMFGLLFASATVCEWIW